jgi:uncharacterized protein YodC (DUF2158 family)
MLVKWMRSDGMSAVKSVRGMIEYVNAEHGWFRVRWYAGGTEQHECFKECDIGTVVTLVGHKKNC